MRRFLIVSMIVAATLSSMLLAALHPTALADEQASKPVTVGDLTITAYRVKQMLPGQPSGGGFLSIANAGAAPDKLAAASSPNAGMVEIHTMEVVNDVMTMRPVEDGVEIPAGGTVELKPGGMHLMFMNVAEPFKQGGAVPVTLEFEKAGKIEIAFPVVGLGG